MANEELYLHTCSTCGGKVYLESINVVYPTGYTEPRLIGWAVKCHNCGCKDVYYGVCKEEAIKLWCKRISRNRNTTEHSLNPCPFCNSPVRLKQGGDVYDIRCTGCGMSAHSWSKDNCYDKEAFIDWWNSQRPRRSLPIRNCPICGKPGKIYNPAKDMWYVACEDSNRCSLRTPIVETEAEAVDIWNGEVHGTHES